MDERMVTVLVSKYHQDTVRVTVNGRRQDIPVGVETEIPESFVGALRDAGEVEFKVVDEDHPDEVQHTDAHESTDVLNARLESQRVKAATEARRSEGTRRNRAEAAVEGEDDDAEPFYEGSRTGSGRDLSFLDGNTDAVKAELPNLSDDELAEVRMAEQAGKTRKGVIDAIRAEEERRKREGTSD